MPPAFKMIVMNFYFGFIQKNQFKIKFNELCYGFNKKESLNFIIIKFNFICFISCFQITKI